MNTSFIFYKYLWLYEILSASYWDHKQVYTYMYECMITDKKATNASLSSRCFLRWLLDANVAVFPSEPPPLLPSQRQRHASIPHELCTPQSRMEICSAPERKYSNYKNISVPLVCEFVCVSCSWSLPHVSRSHHPEEQTHGKREKKIHVFVCKAKPFANVLALWCSSCS